MNEETTTIEASCQSKVMERIEGEHICPRPRSFYTQKEAVVWGLWGLSIIVGALSVAVMAFTLMHNQYALYEATHENFTTFLMEVLPYVWIAVFLLMAGVAVYNLRHTKHGYRYSISQILLSSVVLSVAGGGVLHFLGFGYLVDQALGQQMSGYPSQEKFEKKLWQNPKEGRLLGRVTNPIQPPSTLAQFIDVNGLRWKIDISELSEAERTLLFNQANVKMVGFVSEHDVFLFHSCGAFPWLLDKPASQADFEAAREAFELKMSGFEGRDLLPAFNFREGSALATKDSPCGDITPVRRMGH